MKLLLMAALLGAPGPLPPSGEPAIDLVAIVQLRCGASVGTAFRIGRDRLLTAQHVTAHGPCSIGGVPVETVREDAAADLAELRGASSDHFLPIRCRRPRAGRIYFAAGYAFGRFRHISLLLATRWRDDGRHAPSARGMAVLIGEAYPGMSGGPLVDRRGRVVGMVNRGGVSPPTMASRSLSDTFVCRRSTARAGSVPDEG